MAIFEIHADFGQGKVETRRVHARSWIEAWQNANVGAAEDDTARITVRSTADVVDVEIAMSGTTYRVRSVPPADEVTLSEAVTERVPVRSNRDRSGAATDPDLSAASNAPRPAPVAERGHAGGERRVSARRATIQAVEAVRPAPGAVEPPKRKASVGLQTAKAAPDPRDLPQLFTPMAEFSSGLVKASGRERSAIIDWAVDTVWQQVPARLVLGLRIIGRDITVSAARGDGADAYRGARASGAEWPAAIDLSREARMSFGDDPVALWLRALDNGRYPLEVRSVIWHPVRHAAPTPDRDGVRHVLMVIDAARPNGFTDGEMSALRYLCQMVATRLQ
jgi:hypothetical protein